MFGNSYFASELGFDRDKHLLILKYVGRCDISSECVAEEFLAEYHKLLETPDMGEMIRDIVDESKPERDN